MRLFFNLAAFSAARIIRQVFRPTPEEGPSPLITRIAAIVLAILVCGTAALLLGIALVRPRG
jgi:ABC-type branched-subunit amino acid transport system permease subunit